MIDLLRQRLARYACTDALQEEHALKEILQEVALYGLWRANFYERIWILFLSNPIETSSGSRIVMC